MYTREHVKVYLSFAIDVGADPGVAGVLFAHDVFIDPLLGVSHHEQGSTHVTHLHSLQGLRVGVNHRLLLWTGK